MSNIITELLPAVHQNTPASEQTIQDLVSQVAIPLDYINILRISNGMEGDINEDEYLRLWKAENLVEYNLGYHIEEFALGCFLIGSDGGDTAFGLDLRTVSASYGYYLSRPFISVDWDEITILGRTFGEFVETIKRGRNI